MLCKGCGEDKSLIKAHIIPRSFYMDLRKNENRLDLVSTNIKQKKGLSRIGEYDPDILCKECDQFLSKYDDYGKKLLLDQFDNFDTLIEGKLIRAYVVKNYDYLFLKLFLLSVLWRASISKRPFFKDVNLGDHERHIKDLIFNIEDDNNHTYGCTLQKFIPSVVGSLEKTIHSPDKVEISGLNFYKLCFGGYKSLIRVDANPDLDGVRGLELVDGKNAIFLSKHFHDSDEFRDIEKAIRAQSDSKGGST